MLNEANKVAARANLTAYAYESEQDYVDGAPHIKHPDVKRLHLDLLTKVFNHATRFTQEPRILDIGAGDGVVTCPMLELGARVTAVDVSRSQLDRLQGKCCQFGARLEVHCGDINELFHSSTKGCYDIVTANSFLHHIPDYLSMIDQLIPFLNRNGQFFSFQDPLRYDSLGRVARCYSACAYFVWRIGRGDVRGGLKRQIRRFRGVYLSDCSEDNAEYHFVRSGVDSGAIAALFARRGFECEIIKYFSTQSKVLQRVGVGLGFTNSFAVLARTTVL